MTPKKRKSFENRLPLVSLMALGVAMPAIAQQQEAVPAVTPISAQDVEQSTQSSSREVVVVTANKREESVQDIAVAVTAITAQTKQELGIISVTDLTNVVPGLSYTPGNERVTLRGIARDTNAFGVDPGVANYNDGIYTPFALFAGKDPIMIDRVEVLRGPQGTLYGRNAIGGAINTISKRPTDELKADVTVGAGNFGAQKLGFGVSGPITDWLRYRVAGFKEKRDGVVQNYGTGEKQGWEIDDEFLELQLEGDIGDRFTWWVKVADSWYNKSGPPGGSTSTFSTQPYNPITGIRLASGGYNNTFPINGNPAVLSYTQGGNRTDNPFATSGEKAYNTNIINTAELPSYDEAIFEAVYSTDNFDIKYVGGYTYYDYQLPGDGDGTSITSATYNQIGFNPVPVGTPGSSARTIYPSLRNLYQESRSFYSNEINLISTNDSPFQWIVGAYQYKDTHDQTGASGYLDNEPLADRYVYFAGATPVVVANPGRQVSNFGNKGTQDALGVFGQVDYSFNDQWKVTGGLRWSQDEKVSTADNFFLSYLGFGLPFGVPLLDITSAVCTAGPDLVVTYTADRHCHTTFDNTWEATTGTVGAEYTPTDDTLLFAKYSRGYKSGGFQDYVPFVPGGQEVPSEFVDSYEAGWKQEWAALNLTTNAAAFYYNYTDVQTQLNKFITDPVTGLESRFNAFTSLPEVHTTGFELETQWRPTDALNIGFVYAYLNPEVASDDIYVDTAFDSRCLGATPGSKVTCTPTLNVPVDPRSVTSVKGNVLAQSPKNKVALNARYTFDFEDGSSLVPALSYSWRDEFYNTFFNNDTEKSPAYENLDARMTWYSADGHYTLIGFVRNVFDEDQTTSVSSGSYNTDFNQTFSTFSYSLPRTYGAEFQFHW